MRLQTFFILALSLALFACSDERDFGPSEARFINPTSLMSVDDPNSPVVLSNVLQLGINAYRGRVIGEDLIRFTGENSVVLYRVGEGVIARGEALISIDDVRGVYYLRGIDGGGTFIATSIPPGGLGEAPDNLERIRPAGPNGAIGFEDIGDDQTRFHVIRVDDESVEALTSFEAMAFSAQVLQEFSSEWSGLQLVGEDEIRTEFIRLSDGERVAMTTSPLAQFFVFENGAYSLDAGEWQQVDFSDPEVSDFDPPWPSDANVNRLFRSGIRWAASVSDSADLAAGVWFGGDAYTELDCGRGLLGFDAGISENFVHCDMGFGVSQTFVFDAETSELLENLTFLPRATRLSPDGTTLVTIDSATNEVVTWDREDGVVRYDAKGDRMTLDGNFRVIGSEFERIRATAWIRDDGSIIELPGGWCPDVAASADGEFVVYIDRDFNVRAASLDYNTVVGALDDCGDLRVAGLFTGMAASPDSLKYWKNGETIDALPFEIRRVYGPSSYPFAIAETDYTEEFESSFRKAFIGDIESNTWIEFTDRAGFYGYQDSREHWWSRGFGTEFDLGGRDGATDVDTAFGFWKDGLRGAVLLGREFDRLEGNQNFALIQERDGSFRIATPR